MNLKKPIFYDDLLALNKARAQFQDQHIRHLLVDLMPTHDVTLSPRLDNQLYTCLVQVIMSASLPTTNVFIMDPTTAQAILEAKIDDPCMDDFRKAPFREMFINFQQPVPFPSLVNLTGDLALPQNAKIYALQFRWISRDELEPLKKCLYCSSLSTETDEFLYMVAWYDGCTEPGHFQMGELARLWKVPTESVRWQFIWTGGGITKLKDIKESALTLPAYKFLAYLCSTNVGFQKLERIAHQDFSHKGVLRHTTYQHPIYRIFVKNRIVSVRDPCAVGTGHALDHRQKVIGHHAKYRHCPQCKTITAAQFILITGLCKRCQHPVGTDLSKWTLEWRWIAPYERGPDITEQVLQTKQQQSERYLVKDHS